MNEPESPWLSLILGCALIFSGIYGLINIEDGLIWRGVFIPTWNYWLFLPPGLIITFLSIRAIRRGEGKSKPKVYTQEEIENVEKDIEAEYIKRFGALPKPDEETGEKPDKESK